MNNPTDKRRHREARLNAAYLESEKKLDEAIQSMMNGSEYKLHIRHHSHKLATKVLNATRYNQARTNGVTVAVLVSPSLTLPVFGYSVCSAKDSYSRLIGRVQAKEDLVKTLSSGNAQVLIQKESNFSPKHSEQFYRYINQVVRQWAPRTPKQLTKDSGIHPLTFVNENALTLEIKQALAREFAVDTKAIESNFVYVRRFSNQFFGNQFATYEEIQKYANENPDDQVKLESTGGFTVGVFKFPIEGVEHLLYSTSLCLPEDHFNKSLGRKIVLQNIKRSRVFNHNANTKLNNLSGIFKLSSPIDDKYVLLNQLAMHAVGERFSIAVNTYVGGN